MSDKLKEAIEKLKWLSEQISPSPIKEAIDTVVAEVEKPLQSDEQIEAYSLENILANDSVVAAVDNRCYLDA